jgi:hypothetical protein
MESSKKRCMDCAFFSLASEGLDSDVCRLLDKSLSRQETMVATSCERYEIREEGKDIEFYVPEQRDKKAAYEKEIKKYSVYMVALVMLGIGFFYLVTTLV